MKKITRLLCLMALVALVSCININMQNDDSKNTQAEEAKPVSETLTPVYNDDADPMLQLDDALRQAQEEGKFVIAQIGGNWCPWCLRFADFITKDAKINALVTNAFVYVHINVYKVDAETGKRAVNEDVMSRLGNPMRFGYPVLVVLDAEGNVLHIQDSAMLEDGQSYNAEMVARFFEMWTPDAVRG